MFLDSNVGTLAETRPSSAAMENEHYIEAFFPQQNVKRTIRSLSAQFQLSLWMIEDVSVTTESNGMKQMAPVSWVELQAMR